MYNTYGHIVLQLFVLNSNKNTCWQYPVILYSLSVKNTRISLFISEYRFIFHFVDFCFHLYLYNKQTHPHKYNIHTANIDAHLGFI